MMSSSITTQAARFGDVELTIDFGPDDAEDFIEYPIRIIYGSAVAAARASRSVRRLLSTQTIRMAHEVYLVDTCDLPLLLLAGGIEHIFEMLPSKTAPSNLLTFFGLVVEDFDSSVH